MINLPTEQVMLMIACVTPASASKPVTLYTNSGADAMPAISTGSISEPTPTTGQRFVTLRSSMAVSIITLFCIRMSSGLSMWISSLSNIACCCDVSYRYFRCLSES